jgi:hypothetical protein
MTRLPAPARFATYPGDCSHIVGEVKGPNMLGEMLTAVTATYDADTDSTRVGFAYGAHRADGQVSS